MIIKNENVKKTYEGYAEQVIAKLIKSDTEYKLFFNILSEQKIKVPLISIQDDLKPVYRVTKKSISYLNKLLKKYKIEIVTDTKQIKRLVPNIQMNEPYKCKSRTNGKVRKIEVINYQLQKRALPEYQGYIPMTFDNRYADCLPMVIQ